MKSFKLLFFVLPVLLAHAAFAAVQDASDLDDEALSNRVKLEIEALVAVGDKARTEREALEETIASLKEARQAVRTPLPADPGETTGLATLDEQSLLDQVELRERYLAAYRKRKQQYDLIPSLTDTRRKMIDHAMEAVRITEQRAGDLGPLLTELARRIRAGRISQDAVMLGDDGVDGWVAVVDRHQAECAAWLETYGADKQLPESCFKPPDMKQPRGKTSRRPITPRCRRSLPAFTTTGVSRWRSMRGSWIAPRSSARPSPGWTRIDVT